MTEELTYDTLCIRVSGDQRRGNLQLTFPTPLMTPPDTSTYFMMLLLVPQSVMGKGREGRKVEISHALTLKENRRMDPLAGLIRPH
jgi:hypothetical protein